MKYVKNSLSSVFAAILIVVLTGPTAYATGQPKIEHKSATTSVSASVKKITKKKWFCQNFLAQSLHEAGFQGNRLRIAWALAMRESHGHARSVSSTHDYGLFQFNRAAWHKESWWNTKKLLTPTYNIQVAWDLSQHGHTWYPWDINGKGQHMGNYSSASTYSKFKVWYAKYPCTA